MSTTHKIISVDILQSDIDERNIWPLCLPTSRVVQDGESLADILKPASPEPGSGPDGTYTLYLTPHLDIIAATDMVIAQLAVEAIKAKHYTGDLVEVNGYLPHLPNMVSLYVSEMMDINNDQTPMPKRMSRRTR